MVGKVGGINCVGEWLDGEVDGWVEKTMHG